MSRVLLPSAYLPPVQFFSAMKDCDVLIEQYDSYHKQTLRNRCLIAAANGVMALTIPVVKSSAPGQLMRDVRISDHGDWRRQHWNALESAYMNSPFFMYYADDFRPFYERKWDFLIDFNLELTRTVLDLAHMDVSLQLTDSYCRISDGTADLRSLADKQNMPVQSKPYWQVFSRKYGFQAGLSAVDLLFNMGPEFKCFL